MSHRLNINCLKKATDPESLIWIYCLISLSWMPNEKTCRSTAALWNVNMQNHHTIMFSSTTACFSSTVRWSCASHTSLQRLGLVQICNSYNKFGATCLGSCVEWRLNQQIADLEKVSCLIAPYHYQNAHKLTLGTQINRRDCMTAFVLSRRCGSATCRKSKLRCKRWRWAITDNFFDREEDRGSER